MRSQVRNLLLAFAVIASAGPLSAQQTMPVNGRQFPLNQYSPPGTVASWAAQAGRIPPFYFQPVKVYLPSEGRVTFYDQRPDRPVEVEAPAQAALLVGRVYRFKVDNMPEFPGVEFYPSIELVDRLHPPQDKIDQFPVEFELTMEEFDWAADGRLITKVVYLEQPQRVSLTRLEAPRKTETLMPAQNALAEADDRGRPMAIVRLGGRTPDAGGMDPQFFGPGWPVKLMAGPTTVEQTRRDLKSSTTFNRAESQRKAVKRVSRTNPSPASLFGTPIVRTSAVP